MPRTEARRPSLHFGAWPLWTLAAFALALGAGAWWFMQATPAPRDDPRPQPSHGRGLEEAVSPQAPTAPPDLELPSAQRTTGGLFPPFDPQQARDLELLGRVRLFGRVTSIREKAAPGAQIWWDGNPVATCDDRGTYDVEMPWSRVSPRSYGWLTAHHADGASLPREAPLRGGRCDFELQVHGRVRGKTVTTRDDIPLPGVEVELRLIHAAQGMPTRPLLRLTTVSGPDGSFEFAGVPTGTCTLQATGPHHATARWLQVLNRGSVRDLELRLEDRVMICGRFQPWPPIAVASSRLRVEIQGAQQPPARCDAQGRFALPTRPLPTPHWLSLRSDNAILWAQHRTTGDLIWDSHGNADLGNLQLRDPCWIEGEVLGVGVSQAVLEVHAHPIADGGAIGPGIRSCVDPEGRYKIGPLPAMRVGVLLRAGDRVLSPLQALNLVAGETRRLPPIRLQQRLLHGIVRDERGRALPQVRICIEHNPDQGAPWRVLTETRSDKEGAFTLLLPRTTVARTRLVAVHETRLLPARREIPPDDDALQFSLLLRRGLVQHGRILPTTKEATFRTISFEINERESNAIPLSRQDHLDADGRFQVDGLEDRIYEVVLIREDGGRHRIGPRRPDSAIWEITLQ